MSDDMMDHLGEPGGDESSLTIPQNDTLLDDIARHFTKPIGNNTHFPRNGTSYLN